MKTPTPSQLKLTVLSLSLLTVMAGAAVAPALSSIRAYFADADHFLIQLVVCLPSLFIILTNLLFPKLCAIFRTKQLLMIALLLYTVCGVAAGLCNNIGVLMIFRALVGVGVGIIMPLSTGLLAFYYDRDQQPRLMGWSSALNQVGGVISMLLSGYLSAVSWRCSFLVYLMGLICIVLCIRFLPNEQLARQKGRREKGTFRKYFPFILAMFLLMLAFYVYPSSFALESAKSGLSGALVPVVMASMNFCALLGALSFARVKRVLEFKARFPGPVLFLAGFLLLYFVGGTGGCLAGSVCVGLGLGLGIPFIMNSVSQRAGKIAATTVMPMVSVALYLGQFVNPFVQSAVGQPPFLMAIVAAVIYLAWNALVVRDR